MAIFIFIPERWQIIFISVKYYNILFIHYLRLYSLIKVAGDSFQKFWFDGSMLPLFTK